MVALAEQERVTAAVGDVRQANAAVKEEDAVPRDAGKIRRTARTHRALAGAAAITAHPIETPGPRWGEPGRCREFHHAFGQWVRGAEQDLDDLGRGGIPPPDRIVIAGIAVVPLLV